MQKRVRGFERVKSAIENAQFLPKPRRETMKSAGYDIRAVHSEVIEPNEMKVIHTGLTVYMQDEEFLDLRLRSGLAYNYQLTLQNDAGVIDADYYGKEIKVMIRNEGKTAYPVSAGERIAQGIFTPYLVTDDDNPVNKERDGGFGSTGDK